MIGSAVGLALAPDVHTLMVTIPAAAIGSLFPDIDTVNSRMGRALYPVSFVVSKLTKHRGFTHSLAMVGLLYLALQYLTPLVGSMVGVSIPHIAVVAFVAGHVSHMVGDIFTNRGVQLFWPFDTMIKFPVATTGNYGEYLLAVGLSVLVLIYWFEHSPIAIPFK